MNKLTKHALTLIFALGFVFVTSMSSLATVQAQWPWDRRDNRQDRRDDRRDDRWDRRDDRRDRRDDRWDNRNYNRDYDRGFRDGLDRGQEDYRKRRAADPNNSSHFRKGNAAYRDGFRKGYWQGYPTNRGRRW
jgi:hypothetical protein